MYKIKLSPYHKIFYNEWKLDPQSCKYNIVFDQTISSSLDIPRLKNALHRFVADYLIINSHVKEIDEELYWVPNQQIYELEHFDGQYTKDQIFKYVSEPFNIEAGPLYRFAIFNESDGNCRLVFILHHLIIDGNSFDDFISQICMYYNDISYNTKTSLKEQEESLVLITGQLYNQQTSNVASNQLFWSNIISDTEAVDLRFIKSRKDLELNAQCQISAIRFEFNKDTVKKLSKLKSKYDVSPYLFGLTIFTILLNRYTSQSKFALSFPSVIKECAGLFFGAGINTNVISCNFEQKTTVLDLFTTYKEFVSLIKTNNYGYYPINNIIENGDSNILDVFFAKTNLRDCPFTFSNAKSLKINKDFSIDSPSNLLFEQELSKDVLFYNVKYNQVMFDELILEKFIFHYKKLFTDILSDLLQNEAIKPISQYQILTSEEYQTIVYAWNQTEADYPSDKTIHELFEEQVLKTPNNIAVVYEDTKLTYSELNIKANQLAHYLINTYNIQGDDLIALCLDRSEHMLIAIIAVLKSGGAYVPLDPGYPDIRIIDILKETKALVLIVNNAYEDRLTRTVSNESIVTRTNKLLEIVTIDSGIQNTCFGQEPIINPETTVKSSNLVYVLYTSGTTGKPKGIMLQHIGCVNRIINMIRISHMSGVERVLFKTNYVFDVSFSDIFVTLISGATLFITKNIFDIDEIETKIISNSINVCHFTPSQFDIIKNIKSTDLFRKFKVINFSGEALNCNLVKNIDKDVCCINYYGPTETGEVTADYVGISNSNQSPITIGYPFTNIKLFVLNSNFMPLPIGAIGELYIAGIGLASGYLYNPELTNQKFIHNFFKSKLKKSINKNDYLYKTGDLVRYLSDGNIEYIGRNDSQIKIRGYRIELGEIESQLLKIPEIKQAIVRVESDSTQLKENKYIVAYYVADFKLDEVRVIGILKESLLEYMIPNLFIYLESLPITKNGKLDVAKLPKIKVFDDSYEAPKNYLQTELVEIWSEILELPKEKISITDNFFKLGGNSILIIKLQSRLSKIDKFKNIKTTDLFKYTTIEQLVRFNIGRNSESNFNIINASNDTEVDIAIISMSGAFSGCENIDQYWQLIQEGREGITRVSIDECREHGIPESLLENTNFIPVSGHIPHIDKFDALFWGLAPNEAKKLDPYIRKFLENCWYVLESAGYIKNRSSMNIGVFAGSSSSKYQLHKINNVIQDSAIDIWEAANLGVANAIATYASYLLALTGPSINIYTACSTSLVAIVEACQKLASSKCDLAIAGGVSLLMPDELGYIYQEGMIFSKDGHCRTFDEQSSGTVFGSGIGTVLLKRLSDAKRDNDNIIAVIKGYATNNDGNRKISYTAPSELGQMECIVSAQKMAGITSNMISYIECHGTGTKLGDPIEVKALDSAFKYNHDKNNVENSCVIGSVKANIGHADAAAGIAGVLKVCKMLEHNIIPKQINFNIPNSELQLNKTKFRIATETETWQKESGLARIAGISSLGIGGTNAHIIISEYVKDNLNKVNIINNNQSAKYFLPFSAKSLSSLNMYRENFVKYLEQTSENIEDIAYTLQQTREHFDYRMAIVCDSMTNAIDKLKLAPLIQTKSISEEQEIIFMFPGQGNQYVNMSLSLYKGSPEFKKIVDNCINITNQHLDMPFETILFPQLYKSDIDYDINQTQWAQIALFIVSYSLAKFMENYLKIVPKAYIGHSIGELVAAALSEVFSLEDALKLVIARGSLMQGMAEGGMLAVLSDDPRVKQIIHNNGCEVSVINSPKNYIVSGSRVQVNNLKSSLNKLNIACVLLDVSHAFHSAAMNIAAQEFVSKFIDIKLNPPTRLFISNVTGDFILSQDAINPHYWGGHIRNKVLFSNGVTKIFEAYSNPFFIEVGPGGSLLSSVKDNNTSSLIFGSPLLNSSKENLLVSDINSKDDIICKLWTNGCRIEFNKYYFYDSKSNQIAQIPNYSFERNSYWIEKRSDLSEDKLGILPKNNWLSIPVWKKIKKLYLDTNYVINSEVILIFVEKNYTKLYNFVTDNNLTIFVRIDNDIDDYMITENYGFIINPVSETAYFAITEYLKKNSIKPTIVIHAITLSDDDNFSLSAQEYLNKGFYSLFLIQQYVLSNFSVAKFIVLTNKVARISDVDIVNPCNGAMVGALRSIKHELTNIKSSILDIGSYNPGMLSHILQFINDDENFIEDRLYALKFGALWVEDFEQIKSFPNTSKSILKDEDVVIIVDSMGQMGVPLAKIIAKDYKVIIILVSTSDVTNSLLEQSYTVVSDIRDNGSILDIMNFDISNVQQVNKLIDYSLNKYGKVSGIIYADSTLPLTTQARNIDSVKMAIRTKIDSVANFDSATKDLDIKYFIMMSSLASIIGDVNRIEFCAANSYLDYVPDSNLFSQACCKLTINWPKWQDMALVEQNQSAKRRDNNNLILLNTINSDEVAKQFYKLIQQSLYSRIIISKINLTQLTQKLFDAKYNEVEKIEDITLYVIEKKLPSLYYKIAECFLGVLHVDKISIYDNFFNLGGNSLSAIKLTARLQQIGINLSLTDVILVNSIDKIYQLHGDRVAGGTSTQIMIPLCVNNTFNKNVFFIHAVGGSVIFYLEIAKRLNKNYNYYGIQNINISGKQLINVNTLEELSSIYLDEILKIQPDGEYILMGSSFGGTVSYEIAKQLINMGKTVKYVAMFDSWAMFSNHFKDKNVFHKIMKEEDQYDVRVGGTVGEIDYNTLRDAGWQLMQLLFNYHPEKTNIKIYLYKANYLDDNYQTNGNYNDNGWQQFTDTPITTYQITGNHFTIHIEPGISEMLVSLNNFLV